MNHVLIEARYLLREKFENRLRAALLQEAEVSFEEMAEAVERQILQGGHLGTNLWELGFIEGEALTRISCALLGTPAVGPAEILSASTRIFKLLAPHTIQQDQILPFHLEGRALSVAMSEPWDLSAIESAARECGYAVRAHYLAEIPMARVLHRVLGVPISARFELGRRLMSSRGAQQLQEKEGSAELISEDAFQALYAAQAEGAPPSVAATPTDRLEANMALEEEDPEEAILELLPEDIVSEPVQALVPLNSLEEAIALLETATHRLEVADILIRSCLRGAKRVALLVLDGDFWAGWTGGGVGVNRDQLENLMVPAAKGTMFGLVASTGAHFLGPLGDHPVHARFIKSLGGGAPSSAGLFPVRFRGRVAFGLYLDGGAGQPLNPDIADVLLLAQRVPGTLQALIKKRLRTAVSH